MKEICPHLPAYCYSKIARGPNTIQGMERDLPYTLFCSFITETRPDDIERSMYDSSLVARKARLP